MERNWDLLIVDDDVDLATNLRDILETKGYSTAVAHDGQTALALCHRKPVSLVLIDIKLPDISGVELIERLTELSPGMEFIIITGHASLETAIEAVKQEHIVAYEVKPLDMDNILALTTQIIERKKMEKQLIEYEELNKLKSDLLAKVSHELRTPLATIKGYSTMLLNYEPRLWHSERHEYLKSIDSATDRLTEMVSQLMDMSRIETGLLKLDKAPTNISKLLEKIVAEAQLRTPGHKIVKNTTKRPLRANIDSNRIRQITDNLIDNACKYSKEGTEVVVSDQRSDHRLIISVTDQGIGIPADKLEGVFEQMYYVESVPFHRTDGLGLGLAICKGLVEAHGGRIWAESKMGEGSTFYFNIPL
jgi:two-component system sensor histidine kinase/response regulator